MKTLHRKDGDYFLRMNDSTKADWKQINKLISKGWDFADKAAYKAKIKAVLSEKLPRNPKKLEL
jgi:hypothetical protein